jgi:hypothetical protein
MQGATIRREPLVARRRIHITTGISRVLTHEVSTLDIDEVITEKIENATIAAWNNTYSWHAKFHLALNTASPALDVTVRVYSSAAERLKKAWTTAIQAKWSGRHTLVVRGAGGRTASYPISVGIDWVADRRLADHRVNAVAPAAVLEGTYGTGGTLDMINWGTADRVDITHEFGHMLGNVEEYFTTNGCDYTYGGTKRGYRDKGAGIMNNPAENPFARHYDLIRRKAAILLGVSERECTVS